MSWGLKDMIDIRHSVQSLAWKRSSANSGAVFITQFGSDWFFCSCFFSLSDVPSVFPTVIKYSLFKSYHWYMFSLPLFQARKKYFSLNLSPQNEPPEMRGPPEGPLRPETGDFPDSLYRWEGGEAEHGQQWSLPSKRSCAASGPGKTGRSSLKKSYEDSGAKSSLWSRTVQEGTVQYRRGQSPERVH